MLGIDVSQAELVCTLVDPQTGKDRWQKTVPNTPAGVGQLLAKTPAAIAWVLEPTGRYSLPVVQQARGGPDRLDGRSARSPLLPEEPPVAGQDGPDR